MKKLENRVAVITGGSRGIGFAIAEKFVKEGAKVLVADILEEQSKEAVAKLKEMGADADYFVFDTTKVDEVYAMVKYCIEKFGRIDIMVPCAGVQKPCPSMKVTEELFDFIMDVDIKGVFFCCQAAAREMRKQGGGVIVNISSVNAIQAHVGRAPYCIAKRGVNALTAVLGAEWAMYGIRVNAVGPGSLKTAITERAMANGLLNEERLMSITPVERWGKVSEIADTVCYLASDEASYICGQTIYADGGWTSFILPNALDYIKQNDDMNY